MNYEKKIYEKTKEKNQAQKNQTHIGKTPANDISTSLAKVLIRIAIDLTSTNYY